MAVSLEKIYYSAIRKYNMELIAGKNGIWSSVNWIHIVEDFGFADFLKGQELVIITGVKQNSEKKLLEYAKTLHDRQIAGIIFNIGPYIEKIPESVIEYGNSVDLPMMTLPWTVYLVDFNHEYCRMIIEHEQKEQNLCSAYKNAIFRSEDSESYIPTLKREMISLSEKYCMLKFLPEVEDKEKDLTKQYILIRRYFERVINRHQLGGSKYVIFRSDEYITIILPNINYETAENVLKECSEFGQWTEVKGKLYAAMSNSNLMLEDLRSRYDVLTYMLKLNKRHDRTLYTWNQLGGWKLIFSIGDRESLIEYKNDIIGELETYDANNKESYCNMLNLYLEKDGNMNDVATELFIHRNTVSYHLKKIEEILKCDLYSEKNRTELYMALRIKEILEL